MIGDYHVRFCEGLGVKLPRSTRRTARGKGIGGAYVLHMRSVEDAADTFASSSVLNPLPALAVLFVTKSLPE
jgi:hypothetical protein